MPREVFGPGYAFLKDPQLMTQEEIIRIARAFAALGVEKVRLTGGEPLLRADLPAIISRLRREVGIADVALTTNGWLLEKNLPALQEAGLSRLNISVDALNAETAGKMNGLGYSVAHVLAAVDAAAAAGFPLKINCVLQRGVNDHELLELCEYFRQRGHPLRFIEFMDVGNTNHWSRAAVVPAREIRDRISARWPIVATAPAYRGEVAARYRYVDGRGEVGIISSVTEPFCADCHRARLSADGRLFTCLFAATGTNVLGTLRSGASDAELQQFVGGIWSSRSDRYSDERAERLAAGTVTPKVEMSFIGG